MPNRVSQEVKEYYSGSSVRIEVCGGIASGKTTLASLMQRTKYDAALENFRLNPFIENFYADPQLYAFETEISFLLQHYSQIKTKARSSQIMICDYSFYLDLAYAHVTLKPPYLSPFNAVFNTAFREVGPPTLLVYLLCSAKTEMERIRHRRRAMEDSISIEYLDRINKSLEIYVAQACQQIKVLELNSEKLDFAHEPRVQDQVVELVVGSLPTKVL